mgnify:CR=1 FL=1
MVQSNFAVAFAASTLLNIGLILATVGSPAGQISNAAKAALAGAKNIFRLLDLQLDFPQNITTQTFIPNLKKGNEISFNKITLNHFGRWVDPSKTSEDAKRLRAHEGKATNLDLGTELEFFPLEIHAFETFAYNYAPFISLGVHYTSFNPKVSTTYANPDPTAVGDVTNPSNFYSLWEPGSVDASPGSTFSLVTSVGVRYKVNKLSDLMLNLRWQYYFNDSVDGLDHQLASNKYNDWLLWLNVGYIYYLD